MSELSDHKECQNGNGNGAAIILQEERLESYLALEKADNRDIVPFIELVGSEVEHSLKTMEKVIKGNQL